MKKLLAFIVALVMLLSAVACTAGGKKEEDSKPAGPSKPEDTEYVHTLPDIDYDGQEYRVSAHEQYVTWEVGRLSSKCNTKKRFKRRKPAQTFFGSQVNR